MAAGATVVLVAVDAEMTSLGDDLRLATGVAVVLGYNTLSMGGLADRGFKAGYQVCELGQTAAFEAFDGFVDVFKAAGDLGAASHVLKACETDLVETGEGDEVALLAETEGAVRNSHVFDKFLAVGFFFEV